MTALTSRAGPSSSQALPSINHRCFRRKSLRTYELLDPANPGHVQSYDVGQVKEIVQMDKRLREEGTVSSVPAGFHDFATCFNKYTTGPERFATYFVTQGRVSIQSNGRPIVWGHFMIDDWLVGWDRDAVDERSAGSSPLTPLTPQLHQDPLHSLDLIENITDPKLQALSTRMKVAIQTTDELTKFWIKRGAIEHQYASRLANLAETMIGESDSQELRRAIDAVRVETAQQAMRRHDLATRIAMDLENRCVELQLKQRVYWQDFYAPSARKLYDDIVRQSRRRSGIASEWKQEYKKLRYSLDTRRLQSMKPSLDFTRGSHGGSLDVESVSETSIDSPQGPLGLAKSWDELCNSCWQVEKDRCHLMEETLGVFIDTLSVTLDTDRRSVNTINQWKDLFKPRDFIDEFSQRFNCPQTTTTTTMNTNGYTSSSSSPRPLPRRPAVAATPNQEPNATQVVYQESPQKQRPWETQTAQTPADVTRSTSSRERSRHSMGSLGTATTTTFGPRSHTRSQSQRHSTLLPLSPEPPHQSQSRPTLAHQSKIANVFQRTSNNQSDRDGYGQ